MTILNKTRSSYNRYQLIKGSQGNYGLPNNHVNHYFVIVNGIDRGNGYQGYMSVSYFFEQDSVPHEAKEKAEALLKDHGYDIETLLKQ